MAPNGIRHKADAVKLQIPKPRPKLSVAKAKASSKAFAFKTKVTYRNMPSSDGQIQIMIWFKSWLNHT